MRDRVKEQWRKSHKSDYPQVIEYLRNESDADIFTGSSLMTAAESGWMFAKESIIKIIDKKANWFGYVRAESLKYDIERTFITNEFHKLNNYEEKK